MIIINSSETLYSFATGEAVDITKVKDEVFASKTLGDGIAVKPTEGVLYSPCNASVATVADTSHAVTLTSESGAEILLHVGIDTVELKGAFFSMHARRGQKVKAGDKLISFQKDKVEYTGYDSTICMAICNSDEFRINKLAKDGSSVDKNDVVITLER